MAIKKQIQELQKRREEVQMGGGEKAIEKQEAMGKMTARNRINALLDEIHFRSMTCLSSMRPGILTWPRKSCMAMAWSSGRGTISGQPVCIFAQDFTVAGGSLGLMHSRKIVKIMEHALKMKVPLIGINDSGGATNTGRSKFPWRGMVRYFSGIPFHPE